MEPISAAKQEPINKYLFLYPSRSFKGAHSTGVCRLHHKLFFILSRPARLKGVSPNRSLNSFHPCPANHVDSWKLFLQHWYAILSILRTRGRRGRRGDISRSRRSAFVLHRAGGIELMRLNGVVGDTLRASSRKGA